MTKVIKLTEKIPRVDINHYLASSVEENRVCVLSERDVTIIRSYLFPGVEWSTRFVRPLGGDNYETATDEEFSEYQETINELDYKLSGDLTMSLEDGLIAIANSIVTASTANANAMARLTNSIVIHANAQCCGIPGGESAGVLGTVDTGDTGPIPIYGETPLDTGREPGTFPPEFEDEESYLVNKCAVANLLVDGIIGTLHGYATFTVFNATAVAALIALATASVIIMPPVAIPIMVGCILALIGFTTYFEGMSNEIEARREEYVCILYEGETIEVIISLLADFIDAVLSTLGGAGWVNRILKQVFILLNNPETLKQLYDGVAGATYPNADCSGCEACRTVVLDTGTFVSGDDDSGVYQGAAQSGQYYLVLWFNYEEGQPFDYSAFCGGYERIIAVDPQGITPGVLPVYRIFDQEQNQVYGSNDFATSFCGAGVLVVVSTTPFTVTINRIEACVP